MKRRFEFPVKVVKAYVDESTKKRHLIAVASDDQIDYYLERFTKTALDDMVFYAQSKKELKPEEGLVDLMETHWETFGFGFVVDGWINRNIENSSWEFYADIELKDGWPQGDELYNDVKKGIADKQLSVGGYLENWEEDTDWEEVEIDIEENSDPIKLLIRLLKHFVLEHIATTPADGAANPRTRFETAEMKSLGFVGQIYKSLSSDDYQEDYARIQKEMIASRKSNATKIDNKTNKEVDKPTKEEENSFVEKLCNFLEKTVIRVFNEREDRMDKIEKAKKLAEELNSLMEDKEIFTDEIKETTIKMFVPEIPEEDNKEDVNFEDVAKSVADESVEKAISPVQTELKDLTDRVDAVNPEIELVRKSIEDLKGEIAKAVKTLSGLEKLDERIKSLEDNVEDSHLEPNKKDNVPVEKDVKEEIDPIYAVWNKDKEEEE